jgi:N-acetyl sugar amidotransferase
MNSKILTCTNCVLDSSEPLIRFDENGICQYCNEYFQKKIIIENDKIYYDDYLKKMISNIKNIGKNNKYDCIIGLSGGVDSSYVAHLVIKYKLRPLAVHLDNGWNAEIAVSNIENICNKLNIDLYTHVINWDEFKDLQLSFLKASVRNAEAPTDHAIFSLLYQIANKFNVKYIIDGINHSTEYVRSKGEAGGYAYSDLKQIKGIHRKFGSIPLNTFPMLSFYKKFFYKHICKLSTFSILDYTEYNKQEALELLNSQYNWKSYGEKHHESIFTKWHQVIYLKQKFGYDKRKAHLSDLILSNQITREKALSELAKPAISKSEEQDLIEYIRKKLGLSVLEYNNILNAPIKSHRDYPNDEWIIDLYAKFKKIYK